MMLLFSMLACSSGLQVPGYFVNQGFTPDQDPETVRFAAMENGCGVREGSDLEWNIHCEEHLPVISIAFNNDGEMTEMVAGGPAPQKLGALQSDIEEGWGRPVESGWADYRDYEDPPIDVQCEADQVWRGVWKKDNTVGTVWWCMSIHTDLDIDPFMTFISYRIER